MPWVSVLLATWTINFIQILSFSQFYFPLYFIRCERDGCDMTWKTHIFFGTQPQVQIYIKSIYLYLTNAPQIPQMTFSSWHLYHFGIFCFPDLITGTSIHLCQDNGVGLQVKTVLYRMSSKTVFTQGSVAFLQCNLFIKQLSKQIVLNSILNNKTLYKRHLSHLILDHFQVSFKSVPVYPGIDQNVFKSVPVL